MGLIVIEGLDGAGKSTQISRVGEYLTAEGRSCYQMHFPRTDGSHFGELIASFLRGELGQIHQVNPYLVALLYASDRLEFKPMLENLLSDNDIVLFDRYVYSNIAYQCAKIADATQRRKLQDWILQTEFEVNRLPKPDLNIFLDVPFQFTRQKLAEKREDGQRLYLKGKEDIHETDLAFQDQVREMYLSLVDEEKFIKIDCSNGQGILSVDQIFNKITNVLNNLNLKK